jgi:hypothetical protein
MSLFKTINALFEGKRLFAFVDVKKSTQIIKIERISRDRLL